MFSLTKLNLIGNGKPKYNVKDSVTFTLGEEKISGIVYIVDANGTFENPNEVSYDILATYKNSPTLFKHIPESLIIP